MRKGKLSAVVTQLTLTKGALLVQPPRLGSDAVGVPSHVRPEYVFVSKLVDVVLRGGAEEEE